MERVTHIELPAALDVATAKVLRDRVRAAVAGPAWPIVFRGERSGGGEGGGEASFCTGVSLAAAVAEDVEGARAAVAAIADALELVLTSPVPTIAVVEGKAIGGGVGLAAACDRVIAAEGATFALPELLHGLVPALIAPALRRRLTPAHFGWLAMTGFARGAKDAAELGLVDEVVPAGDLTRALGATLRAISRLDPLALARARAHLVPARELRVELARAVDVTLERLTDPVVVGRLRAFLHDGVPTWRGRDE